MASTNIKKTDNVKTRFTKALFKLMETTDYSKITISELTTEAKVSRVSFYRNYQDKSDIVKEYFRGLIKPYNDKAPTCITPNDVYNFYLSALEDFKSHKKELTVLNKNNLLMYYTRELLAAVRVNFKGEPGTGSYYNSLIFSGSYSLMVLTWIQRDFKEPPSLLARTYTDTMFAGRNPLSNPVMADILK
jgi:AcrR family transcriptional regulator